MLLLATVAFQAFSYWYINFFQMKMMQTTKLLCTMWMMESMDRSTASCMIMHTLNQFCKRYARSEYYILVMYHGCRRILVTAVTSLFTAPSMLPEFGIWLMKRVVELSQKQGWRRTCKQLFLLFSARWNVLLIVVLILEALDWWSD